MDKIKTIVLTDKSFYREQYYNGGQPWYKGFFVGSVRHGYSKQFYYIKSKTLHRIEEKYYAR
jgi:hypothetical protein